MHQVDFSGVDLNLLKLFDALLKARSVTGAGQRLGLSQPAASRALARLRRLLNSAGCPNISGAGTDASGRRFSRACG